MRLFRPPSHPPDHEVWSGEAATSNQEARPRTSRGYNEGLASRIREVLDGEAGLTEKKMFGGLAFLVNGKMAVGITGDDLVVRVGRDAHDDALAEPHAREMDFTGRSLRGFVYVSPEGLAADSALRTWVSRGVEHASTLSVK